MEPIRELGKVIEFLVFWAVVGIVGTFGLLVWMLWRMITHVAAQ